MLIKTPKRVNLRNPVLNNKNISSTSHLPSNSKPKLGFLKDKTPRDFIKERLKVTNLTPDKELITYKKKEINKKTNLTFSKVFEKDLRLIQNKLFQLTELIDSGHIKDRVRREKARAILYNLELDLELAISRESKSGLYLIKKRLLSFISQYFSN